MAARDPIDWHGAWSLSDYLVYLIAGNRQTSREYQVMLRLLGQSKLDEMLKAREKEEAACEDF